MFGNLLVYEIDDGEGHTERIIVDIDGSGHTEAFDLAAEFFASTGYVSVRVVGEGQRHE